MVNIVLAWLVGTAVGIVAGVGLTEWRLRRGRS
jgi:hypothetical protein